MRPAPNRLEEPYRARALAPGSPRYWSWTFARPELREPLLGVYALTAEWRALRAPSMEAAAARIKLAWWREEVRRLAAGNPLHPITRHLAALPGAGEARFDDLQATLDAVEGELGGVPLERGAGLEAHCHALGALPLRVAARLGAGGADHAALGAAATAYAVGEYLAEAAAGYRGAVRAARMPFPVDELLAAGIEDADLDADRPPPRLSDYLAAVRARARARLEEAARLLPAGDRPGQRHLLVLAALVRRRLEEGAPPAREVFRIRDLLLAWRTARRALIAAR